MRKLDTILYKVNTTCTMRYLMSTRLKLSFGYTNIIYKTYSEIWRYPLGQLCIFVSMCVIKEQNYPFKEKDLFSKKQKSIIKKPSNKSV